MYGNIDLQISLIYLLGATVSQNVPMYVGLLQGMHALCEYIIGTGLLNQVNIMTI